MGVTTISSNKTASPMINPISGAFGAGKHLFIFESQTLIAPYTGLYRVRIWGGGGATGSGGAACCGAGGGFSLKTIALTKGDEIQITIGAGGKNPSINGGTTSFGSHFSATGGDTSSSSNNTAYGGYGVGGDINKTGGNSYGGSYKTGAGAASIYGDGGDSYGTYSSYTAAISKSHGSTCGIVGSVTGYEFRGITAAFQSIKNIDEIGAGIGANSTGEAGTGGGGRDSFPAGFPAGGSGHDSVDGADGLCVVEFEQ